jgi:hypothetical protein
MAVKVLVLGSDKGLFNAVRDIFPLDPQVAKSLLIGQKPEHLPVSIEKDAVVSKREIFLSERAFQGGFASFNPPRFSLLGK